MSRVEFQAAPESVIELMVCPSTPDLNILSTVDLVLVFAFFIPVRLD